jgi:hypothetical protein
MVAKINNKQMKNELRTRYKQDFKKVSTLVNQLDPCGIIKGGAPPNEYDCLTDKILSCYYKNQPRSEIKKDIIHELVFHFGTLDSTAPTDPDKNRLEEMLELLLDKIEGSLTREK